MMRAIAMKPAPSVLLAVLLTGVLGGSARSAQEPAGRVGAVVLVVTFADGRVVHHVVTGTPGSSWTPMFPRLAAAGSAAEPLPITALKHTHVLRDDGAVTVGVSVLRGASREREDAIATVDVAMNQRIDVDALRAVGVAPLVLSLTALTPTTLYVPSVLNRTAGLEVTDVTVVAEPSPRYRITVRNLSAQAAIAFRVRTYRGDRLALSGMQGNKDASSIIDANGTYSFVMKPSSGLSRPEGWSPASHERIEIAAALWEDGSIEGDAGELTGTLALYIGRRAQLIRGLSALMALGSPAEPRQSKAWLAARIEALSIEPDEATADAARSRIQDLAPWDQARVVATLRNAMADTRRGMLDDVRAAPDDGPGFERWLAEIVSSYESAVARFARR
jgi:hypothetical protein